MAKSLGELQNEAIHLHGLLQAYEEIQDSTTQQAFQGRGALLVVMERLSAEIANGLGHHIGR